jgi:hypothetical protein
MTTMGCRDYFCPSPRTNDLTKVLNLRISYLLSRGAIRRCARIVDERLQLLLDGFRDGAHLFDCFSVKGYGLGVVRSLPRLPN